MLPQILSIVGILISSVCTIICSKISSDGHKQKAIDDEKYKLQYLSSKMQASGSELAYITSLAVTGGHIDGNVENAQSEYLAIKSDYDKLVEELTLKKIIGK